MVIALQITPRLRSKTNYWQHNINIEGLIENFNKLCFIELFQTTLRLVSANFFSQKIANVKKISKLAHLMLMVFCYSLWKLWFFMFSGGMKGLVSWNHCGQFLECEAFLNLECKESYNLFDLCLQNIFLAVVKSLFVENFFDQRKSFVSKTLSCLWKTSSVM